MDLINHSDVESLTTEPTILGPFYVPDSPHRDFGASMVEYDDGGEPAVLYGTVRDDSGRPIPGVAIDVWQNAATGFYAVQQPDVQPPTNLRGVYRTDERGRYEIRTVRPVPYPIPADGPVGMLLADTGRHPWRAAHIHASVSAAGFEPLTTHLFDHESKYLDSDTVFGVKQSLIRDFVRGEDGVLYCESDFVLSRAKRESPEPRRGLRSVHYDHQRPAVQGSANVLRVDQGPSHQVEMGHNGAGVGRPDPWSPARWTPEEIALTAE